MHDLIDIARTLDEQTNGSKQLELNFEADPEFKQKRDEFLKDASPRSAVKSEQNLIARLQHGERCPFAGSFMHHLFLQEINYADLVTWAKYITDKQLHTIADDCFTQCIAFGRKRYLVSDQQRQVNESLQTAQKDGRSEPVSLALRLVVLHDINSDRRIGIYTNNHVKSAGDIAYYMLSRWGDSKNLYNELMAKFN
ncbi:hypothetical protein JW960_15280, partial [candidate division KSB1 bacterium]|nr:hypothetical protein [candidate division KSB1 bacterium]